MCIVDTKQRKEEKEKEEENERRGKRRQFWLVFIKCNDL